MAWFYLVSFMYVGLSLVQYFAMSTAMDSAKFWKKMSKEWENQAKDSTEMMKVMANIAAEAVRQANRWRNIALGSDAEERPPTIN